MSDWRVICDVCGFEYWASEVRRQWDGLIVCREDFSERHPQELVRGKRDRQKVPFSRPEPADSFVGITHTVLTADEPAGETSLAVSSTTGFTTGNIVHVLMDNDLIHRTTATVASSTGLTLAEGLAYAASSGNNVTDTGAAS